MSDVIAGVDMANRTISWMRRLDKRVVGGMDMRLDHQSKRIDDLDRKLDMIRARLP